MGRAALRGGWGAVRECGGVNGLRGGDGLAGAQGRWGRRVSAAADQAAQNAPGERMWGCGPVPSPQVSMTSTAHRRTYTQHIHPTPHTHTHQPVTHVRSALDGAPSDVPCCSSVSSTGRLSLWATRVRAKPGCHRRRRWEATDPSVPGGPANHLPLLSAAAESTFVELAALYNLARSEDHKQTEVQDEQPGKILKAERCYGHTNAAVAEG